MSVECVIKNAATGDGEGPHWDDVTNTLFHVDIQSKAIHRYNPETDIDEKIILNDTVGFVVPARKGGLIVGLGLSIVHVEWDTKRITKLHSVQPDAPPGSRFNDGKCDPKGRIFAGTMGPVEPDVQTMPRIGNLYCLDLDGSLRTCVTNTGISNGLAWSEDAKTMYYIDSGTNQVYSYDYDVNTGQMSNKKVIVDTFGLSFTDFGFADGMTIDTNGTIWVARYGAAKVVQYEPKTGTEIKSIDLPARRITSCCFGGKKLDELFVTSSANQTSKEEMETYPLSGSVFKVTGLGVKGYPATMYEGDITPK